MIGREYTLGRDYIAVQTLGFNEAPTRRFSELVQAETARVLALHHAKVEAALGRILGEGSWTLRTNNTTPRLAPVL